MLRHNCITRLASLDLAEQRRAGYRLTDWPAATLGGHRVGVVTEKAPTAGNGGENTAMPGMPAPAVGERASLLEYLRYQHQAFFVTAYGLTDEQARCTPTASALSIGGLIKHVTTMEYAWTQQVVAAPARLQNDPWSLQGMMVTWALREQQFVMRPDDTLEELLESLKAQNAASMQVFAEVDLGDVVEVPVHIHAAYGCSSDCTVRWVLLHLIDEFTRHAGHSDIIRESIDGATMYELMAAVEHWPETSTFKPWKPASGSGV